MHRTLITYANEFNINFISLTCRKKLFSTGLLQVLPNQLPNTKLDYSGFMTLICGISVQMYILLCNIIF